MRQTNAGLEKLEKHCREVGDYKLMFEVTTMQGIVARMARNSRALMDETQQCRTAMTVAHIKETAANL